MHHQLLQLKDTKGKDEYSGFTMTLMRMLAFTPESSSKNITGSHFRSNITSKEKYADITKRLFLRDCSPQSILYLIQIIMPYNLNVLVKTLLDQVCYMI